MNAFILSNDSELRALVSRVCSNRAPAVTVLTALPSMQTDFSPTVAGQPDLVIIDASSFPDAASGMLGRMAEKYPQAAIMLLSSDRSPEYLINAMRAGVREVIPLPLASADLDAALDRLSHKLSSTQQFDGKVMTFVSAKGGVGTTFISANLAHALSVLGKKRVLLVDLNTAFGDATLYVSDVKPVRTLADVCRDIHRLDINLLESSVIRVSPTFSVLAAPAEPDPVEDLNPDHVETIMQLARRHYDFVLIDLGRQVSTTSVRVLDNTDTIVLLMQQTLPDLRGARHLLDIFGSLGYRREKTHLLLNRHESGAALTPTEIERILEQKIATRIPNHFEAANESINQGTPILQLARSNPVSKAFADWVNQLADTASPVKAGIIRRIFVRSSDTVTQARN